MSKNKKVSLQDKFSSLSEIENNENSNDFVDLSNVDINNGDINSNNNDNNNSKNNKKKNKKNNGDKTSLMTKLMFILKEDDLDDYVWILDDNEEKERKKKELLDKKKKEQDKKKRNKKIKNKLKVIDTSEEYKKEENNKENGNSTYDNIDAMTTDYYNDPLLGSMLPEDSKAYIPENETKKQRKRREEAEKLAALDIDDRFMYKRIMNTAFNSCIFLIVLVTIYVFNHFFIPQTKDIPLGALIIFFITFIFLSFKNNYFRMKKEFNRRRGEVYNSFPLWVSTLQILIITNNVTNTFKKSIPTCPKAFKRDLEIFVKQIEYDPDNKEHYKNFLKKYKIDEVSEIIMDMYVFNRMDKNEIVNQFSILNERLNKIQNNIRKRKQEQALFFISAMNSIPLLTASVYVLIISMFLASV